tara:strand:- start:307 stop:516 length:210 start_codon:yes stop_codon:yes gene_type:complete
MDSIFSFSLPEQVSISGGDSNPDSIYQMRELHSGINPADLLITNRLTSHRYASEVTTTLWAKNGLLTNK